MAKLFSLYEKKDQGQFGAEITAWKYAPPKDRRVIIILFVIIAAVIALVFAYGRTLLPWLKQIPDSAAYLLFVFITPLLKYFTARFSEYNYTLYENGYKIVMASKGKDLEEKTGFWRDFKTCELTEKGVRLVPVAFLSRAIHLNAPQNRTHVYSICRESISMARANLLERTGYITRTDSWQQRHIEKIESRQGRQTKSFF